MTLILDLPPALSKRLEDEVSRLGLPTEQVAHAALEAGLAQVSAPPSQLEDWKQRLSAAQKDCEELLRDAPIIPLDALRRENLYADDGL